MATPSTSGPRDHSSDWANNDFIVDPLIKTSFNDKHLEPHASSPPNHTPLTPSTQICPSCRPLHSRNTSWSVPSSASYSAQPRTGSDEHQDTDSWDWGMANLFQSGNGRSLQAQRLIGVWLDPMIWSQKKMRLCFWHWSVFRNRRVTIAFTVYEELFRYISTLPLDHNVCRAVTDMSNSALSHINSCQLSTTPSQKM